MKKYHTMLSVAGSDPSGGAGIQADIKTATLLGVYAMTVPTALTVQNTIGVRSSAATDPNLFRQQLQCLLDDITPDAVKVSMLPTAGHVEILAEAAGKYDLRNIVIDPVAISTSGLTLTPPGAFRAMAESLFPTAAVVTPNIPETEALESMGFDLPQICRAVLFKGGHGNSGILTDTLVRRGHAPVQYTYPKLDTPNTHGTGCVLSGAIASHLALGHSLTDAVSQAGKFLHMALEKGAGYSIGHGKGPVCLV